MRLETARGTNNFESCYRFGRDLSLPRIDKGTQVSSRREEADGKEEDDFYVRARASCRTNKSSLNSQLPNCNGHLCVSIGKSSRFIGQPALMVSLKRNTAHISRSSLAFDFNLGARYARLSSRSSAIIFRANPSQRKFHLASIEEQS